MGKITLAGAMPGEGLNGLEPYSKDFLDSELEARLVIALVINRKTVKDNLKGTEYPVLAIQHWEMVPETKADQERAATMLGKALAKRTGKLELPFPPGVDVPVREDFPEDPEFERSLSAVPDADDNEGE